MRRPWRRWTLTTLVVLMILGAATIGVYAAYLGG
jgi:hypothetical protein